MEVRKISDFFFFLPVVFSSDLQVGGDGMTGSFHSMKLRN